MNIRTERRGLGRGLGELFQRTEPQPASVSANGQSSPAPMAPVPDGSYFADLPLDSISPNPRQPRTVFDEEAMNELVESIREVGMLQPIVVRPLGGARFELVMGERRWRAAQQALLETIPAIVRETADHELLRDALLENLHRAQLNPLEEAAAYQQMLEDFGSTQEELASRIKRSRPQISNTIRLLRLPPTVQRRIAAGVISAGHARALLAIEDPVSQGITLLAGSDTRRWSRRRSRISPIGSPITSIPGFGSTWAGPRARSSSSSPRLTTWSASLLSSKGIRMPPKNIDKSIFERAPFKRRWAPAQLV